MIWQTLPLIGNHSLSPGHVVYHGDSGSPYHSCYCRGSTDYLRKSSSARPDKHHIDLRSFSCLLPQRSSTTYTSTHWANFPVMAFPKKKKKATSSLIYYTGPAWRAAFYFPDCWSMFIGNAHIDTQKLHNEYGQVVRISPNALSFNTAQAWKGNASQNRQHKSR